MAITPPVEGKSRALARTLWEAALQLSGPTAALGRIWGFTHPTAFERTIGEWRMEISGAVNSHEERISMLETRLSARIEIGDLALDLAFWLCRQSPNGLKRHVEWDKIVPAFEHAAKGDLEEAVAELKHHGFVTSQGALGHTIIFVTPMPELFWAFDGVVMGFNTLADARAIATLWLDEAEKFWGSRNLEQHLSWERRRLNPALAFVLQFLDPRHPSRELQPDYPTNSVFLDGEDRFRLRQFLRATGAEKAA